MTGTFEGSQGIIKWAANIKTRLANDSTRNAFKELVQVQGFLFLEEYLEEVQRGPTQAAVIEIAKTPGRKKDLPKKTRAAVAAASAKKLRIINANDKENQIPSSTAASLQQALLIAQKEKANGVDDIDDEVPASPKKRNPLGVSIILPVTEDPHPTPLQPSASHQLSTAEPDSQSLPMITEQEEEDRKAVAPVKPTPHPPNALKLNIATLSPSAHAQKSTPQIPIIRPSSRMEERVIPSRIPTPTNAEFPVRPSTPIRSPLARATSPLASRIDSNIRGPRSPSPSKVIKGTPGSPAFVTRIPRSPKLGFQVGSAPLPNVPRSPLVPRKDLAQSGPETAHSSVTESSNPAPAVRPSNAGEGALPPAPKVRSSFLQRHAHDGPLLLGGAKKSMGSALVAKKSVAGPNTLLASTAGSSATKWKAEMELVERAEKGFKSTYESESSSALQRKRKSEVEDDENYGSAMRKSKVLKASHGAPLRASADLDSDDEYEGDEFMKLRETVGNLKRQKSLHMVDIDITTRLNVKIPAPPVASDSAPALTPQPEELANPSSSQPHATERSSRSHERLSISELMSSTESQKAKKADAVPSKKNTQTEGTAAPKAVQTLISKKEWTLLMASSNTSTTPPNSPPPSSLPPAVPRPPTGNAPATVKPSSTRSALPDQQSAIPSAKLTAAPRTETPPVIRPTPASPIAAHALASNPFSSEAVATKQASGGRNFTEIPADLFMAPPRAAQLQPPAPPVIARQSSVATISTQASYTDSIFSTQGAVQTQPTEYGLSQEALPVPVEVKAKAKIEQQPAALAPERHEAAMEEDVRADTPASSYDDGASSQDDMNANGGLFTYATQFMSKAFGVGSAKKPKPESHAKVFENAAAARKEQEEKEKKKVERKEIMEARRLAVSQKKVEEDRARQQEHERKVKEEIDRRKREREEMNASKIVGKPKKMEEPEAKKRKITAEVERKPELKKQPSKDKLNSSFQAAGPSALPRFNPPRPAPQPTVQPSSQPKTLVKKPSGNLASGSNTFAQPSTRGPSFDKLPPPKTASNMPPPETGSFKPAKTLTATGKGKAPESVFNAPPALKSAAGKARPPQSMQVTLKNVIASEDIVLEEPNSEYSDSEDEGRNNDRPSWTQSPNLRQALEQQAQYNPDLIFGPIPTLDMGEMFPQRKFRPRSSSANWEGHALSKEEQITYNEKMGYMSNIAE